MNKELRNGLEIAANYYYLREEALIELTLKEQQYEKKKKYYEDVLRSAQRNGKTVAGILLMCGAILLCLISFYAVVSTMGTDIGAGDLPVIIIGAGPFVIAAVVMLVIGFRLVTSRKARKVQVEERAQKIWDEEVLLAEKEYNDQLETAKAIINPLDEMYREFVEDIIPPSYRCYSDAFALYDLVANGRADSMKKRSIFMRS